MDQHDQELLEKQLRAINGAPPRAGAIIVTMLMVFPGRHDSRRLACWFHRRADARCRQRYGACTVDHAVKALRPAFPCVDWGGHPRASMILEKHPAGGPWMLFRGGRFPRVGQMRSLLGTASHIVRFGWGPRQA